MSTTPPPPEPYQPPVNRGYDDAAPAAPPAYAAPDYPSGQKTAASKRLGVVAFIVSLLGVVIGSIMAFVAGLQSGSIAPYADSSGQLDASTLPPEAQQAAILVGVLSVGAFAVFGILGLWGFIQGIVAAVKNRGRGWGIGAVVVSVLGGIVVIFALGAGAAAGLAPNM